MNTIEIIFQRFCEENSLSVILSYDMPDGYETAYGTYDVTVNTLYLNKNLLGAAPRHEALFYLFHELRHAMQYLSPRLFGNNIQESRFYVILYNGVCYKLIGNEWQKCILEGSAEYFDNAYRNLPYEIDANCFAYEKAKELCGDTPELKTLYSFWAPRDAFDYKEFKKLFCRIDTALKNEIN